MRITVEVKQSHIKNGWRNDSCACPIALAIKTKTGLEAHVSDMIRVRGKEPVETPCVALDFIDKFDDGLPVQPFSFELELVEVPE